MPDPHNTDTTNTESSTLDKLDGESLDISAQRLAAIKAVLPEAFDLDGNLVRDKLLEALKPASYKASDDIPSFGLAWPGKQSAFAAAGVPTTATLRPCPDQSVDFDTTQNLLIEGDNLEVLKTLRRSYHGKVKMIYIDPPYNTGKDFVYPDNYGEGLDTYLQRTEQKDDDGFWKSTNSETSGRKHANWLSMMAPRLTLARNLLRDDGVIFISINDHEVAHLKILCNEIFGPENFLAQFSWRTDGNFDNQDKIKNCHEYILLFAKRKASFPHPPTIDPSTPEDSKLFNDSIRNTIVKNGPRNPVSEVLLHAGFPSAIESGTIRARSDKWPHYKNDAQFEDGKLVSDVIVSSGWSSKDLLTAFIENKYSTILDGKEQETVFEISASGAIEAVKKRPDVQSHVISSLSGLGGSQKAIDQLEALGLQFFDYPKPTSLIEYFVRMNYGNDSIILDFFAGSGTTGHAVMAQNAEDGGNRRYICVQLPEPLDEPVTLDDGVVCETIFDLTRERLKRAGKIIKEEAGLNAEKLDTGLRVFKLDSSNFTAWNSDPTTSEADLLERLEQLNDQTVAGRSETDILWEMLLKMGLPLDLQLEHFELEGASFIGVADRTKVISTAESIPVSALEALLDQDIPPSELVVLDSAFADDSARANIATLYKERKDDDGQPVCKLKVV